jgi:hypothetical protein
MSALGQKATCAPQKVMFALPSEADMCGGSQLAMEEGNRARQNH